MSDDDTGSATGGSDLVERLRFAAHYKYDDDAAEAADEIERLRRWKAEAMEVLGQWEDVWYALGQPGELGEFKAIAALRTVLNGSEDA